MLSPVLATLGSVYLWAILEKCLVIGKSLGDRSKDLSGVNLGEEPREDVESEKWSQESRTGLRGKHIFKEAPEKSPSRNKNHERVRSRSQVGESCG